VRDCFHDVFQLGANRDKVTQLTSSSGQAVSKGTLVAKLREFATDAEPHERILFFFSGHGQRLGEKLYLVPEDAWAAEDAEALIEFDKVLEIVQNSKARQKLIILDACWCGPDVTRLKEFYPASFSKKFLENYLKRTSGTAVIASSSSSQASTTQSPNPKLSLFTYHLVRALQGDPSILENKLLTLPKLFEFLSVNVQRDAKSYHRRQEPVLRSVSSGTMVLGDFRPILNPAIFEVGRYAIDGISFVRREKMQVKQILTKIKNWAYSMEYLAERVNDELGDHFEEDMGEAAARLKKALRFATSDINVEQGRLEFPDGTYWIKYIPDDKRAGRLIHRVKFFKAWFTRPAEIVHVLQAIGIAPTEIKIYLSAPLNPLDVIPGLEANGWEIISQLDRKVEATKDSYDVVVKTESILFDGFSPKELLGNNGSGEQAQVAASVLQLVGGHGA
jgi:hypothetical protein